MKLRALALLLVLANLGFFIWTQGWLDALTGARAAGDHEPEHMARQFQPQLLRVLPGAAGAAAMAGSAVAAATACIEAGPFTMAEAETALAQWRERGVQTARIVQRMQPGDDAMVRIENADAALAARLAQNEGAPAPFGKAFARCEN